MQVTSETPRSNFKFSGIEVSVPMVYAEGATLNANEARAFNRFISGAQGNQFSSELRRGVEALQKERTDEVTKDPKAAVAAHPDWFTTNDKGKTVLTAVTIADLGKSQEDYQKMIDDRYAAYEPGVIQRGDGTGTSTDPVAAMARQLASAKVRELITSKGLKVKAFYEQKDAAGVSKFASLVEDYITRNAWVMEVAKATVASANEATSDGDGLDLSLPEATEEPAAA